jgi:hypothetical protein
MTASKVGNPSSFNVLSQLPVEPGAPVEEAPSVVPRLRWPRLGLAWVVSEPLGIAGLAAGAFFSGEGAGTGVLLDCAKAGCKENVSAINET